MSELSITKHAKERYAERIMDRDSKADVTVFIATNENKIKDDITKMVEFGEKIYSGSTVNHPKNVIDVYLTGTWVVLVDTSSNAVITLYEVDLGLGREFNLNYIKQVCERLVEAQRRQSEVANEVGKLKTDIENQITENESLIADLKRRIRGLENENSSGRAMLQDIGGRLNEAKVAVRDTVSILIGKKVW